VTVSAIAIHKLRVRRGGSLVLDRVSLSVPHGQVVGLLGPSGSGKTTLMRAVVGVQLVEGGEVTVLGRPAGSRELRARVAYVTQGPSVYGDLTVSENLDYFGHVLGTGRDRAGEVLATVDLRGYEQRLVASLSGGEHARVSLAVALLGRPELLVLDEPTVGLDPVLRRSLWESFHQLAADGVTLLVSSHVMDEAERCDRLVLLREGEVLAEGTPDELQRSVGAADVEEAFLALVERQAMQEARA
jgi:ABC-2 type transport system ATP-binding protein